MATDTATQRAASWTITILIISVIAYGIGFVFGAEMAETRITRAYCQSRGFHAGEYQGGGAFKCWAEEVVK